ncbi:hypothetical protein GCM10010429_02210 [Micromonospora olivasterospora]
MPRKVTRGRAAPEGGVTAAMAGIGWVFGYGIVTPVFSARVGGASLRRVRPGRRAGRAGHRRGMLSFSGRPTGSPPYHARAYAAVRIYRAMVAILSLRGRRFRDATDCA